MFGLVSKDKYEKALKAIASLAVANPSAPYQQAVYGYMNNNMPVFWTDTKANYIQQGYQGNADVYSIVDMILTKLSMCPLILYEITPDKVTKAMQYKALSSINTLDAQIKARQLQIKALNETYNNNINDLLNKPNDLQTPTQWIKQLAGFRLLTGNSYNYYNGMGDPKSKRWKEMFVLPAPLVNIISGGEWQPVKGYSIIGSRNYNLAKVDFETTNVSHLKTFNPDFTSYGNQLYGQSPLKAYIMTMVKNRDSRLELNKQIKNGGPMGIFSPAPGAPNIPPDVKQDVKNQLAEARNSDELAKRIIVAMASGQWTQIGLPTTDLQLLESLKVDEKDICKAYHFPPQLLANTEASTDNNMGWAGKQMVYNCIMPLGNEIADQLTRDLCPQNEKGQNKYMLMYDYSVLPELAEDMDKVATYLNKSYWVTPNEKREIMGFGRVNNIPNMDIPLVPNNLVRVDDLQATSDDFLSAAKESANEL